MKRIAALLLAVAFAAAGTSCEKKTGRVSSDIISGNSTGGEPTENEVRETILKVAVIDGVGKLSDALTVYDKAHRDVKLERKSYGIDKNEYTFTEAFNQLTREMLVGDVPDVIIAPAEGMVNLRRNGYFADLMPFIGSSGTVSADDILPNVRRAVEYDGRITCIFPCFNYSTYTASADLIGKDCESWSFEEAAALYEELSDKKCFPQSADMWRFFLRVAAYEAIDFDNMTCDFGGSFGKALDFLVQHPVIRNDYDYKSGGGEYMKSLNITFIDGINQSAAGYIYSFYKGQSVTYLGYPSEKGNGAAVSVPHVWAIPEYSKNKDAAWALIGNYLSLEEQKKMSLEYCAGVPVTESALQALAYDTPEYAHSSVRAKLRTDSSYGEENIYITDEAVEKLLDYSRNVNIDLNYGDQLEYLIRNSWMEVMNGSISAEECINELNNKVGLWLSERA